MVSDSSAASLLIRALQSNSAGGSGFDIFPDDDGNNGNQTGDGGNDSIWDSDNPNDPGLFLIICIFSAVIGMPIACYWFFGYKRRTIQPFDMANNASMFSQATAVAAGAGGRTNARATVPVMNKEELEIRLAKLKERFEQNDIQKVLQEDDFEMEGPGGDEEAASPGNQNDAKPAEDKSSATAAVSSSTRFKQVIRLTPTRTAPNGCAICLAQYHPGEQVVWSGDASTCSHVFHKGCMLDWLVKIPGGTTLCPCCRQNFVDLP